jgi:hypothetical protein
MSGGFTMFQLIGRGAAMLSLAATTALTPTTQAQTTPPPGESIAVLGYEGSGCAPDMTVVSDSGDHTADTVMYADYTLLAGVGGDAPDVSKSCTITVRVSPPPGFTAAIAQLDQRGAADLPAGATASALVSYQSEGSSTVTRADYALTGPHEDWWQSSHEVAEADQVFGACGQPQVITVKTELRVSMGMSDPESRADASIDSTDFATNYFNWKECA